MVHLIRHLLDFVSQKDRKAVVPTLSAICRGANGKPARRVWRTSRPATGPAIPGDHSKLAARLAARRASSPIRVRAASSTRRMRSKCPRRVGAISNSA
ncbi:MULTISPECIES: hypothetical protein [Mesorhizobium]|uniref:hypothetical protein n=1 Tax=Mesorhizobium norvegicum TaxID=1085774 RepID=UPI0010A96D4F